MGVQEYNNNLLKSIHSQGIVASGRLKKCLGSSDQTALKEISVNALRKVNEESIKQLVYARANGIIPISLERKSRNIYSIPDPKFSDLIAERAQTAALFIIDSKHISKEDKTYKYLMTPNRFDIGEVCLTQSIPTRAIKAVVVTENLKELVASIFEGIEVHTVPLVEKIVNVDVPQYVIIPPEIQYNEFFRMRVVKVQVPDYIPFLTNYARNYFQEESDPLVFHVSRLATPDDLSHI